MTIKKKSGWLELSRLSLLTSLMVVAAIWTTQVNAQDVEASSKKSISEQLEQLITPAMPSDTLSKAPASAEEGAVDSALDGKLALEMESLKQALVSLNRDLFILEEDLLFPSSTQLAVYVSMDVGEYFSLDAVELKVDGRLATHYLYTQRQVNALYRGGVQRLYVGNINQGKREITAFFIGTGPENRPYKRALTFSFDKDDEAASVELKIIDSTLKQQPLFSASLL